MDKDKFENLEKDIEPRIRELVAKGLYLETSYFYLIIIEFTLQCNILYTEELVGEVLEKAGMTFSRPVGEKIDEKTLGQLIAIYSKYNKNSKLSSQLNELNSFRKRIVHHMLDFSVEQLSREAKNKQELFYDVVLKLSHQNADILKKHLKVLKKRSKK